MIKRHRREVHGLYCRLLGNCVVDGQLVKNPIISLTDQRLGAHDLRVRLITRDRLRSLRLGFLVPFRIDSRGQGLQPAEKCHDLPYVIIGDRSVVVPLAIPC